MYFTIELPALIALHNLLMSREFDIAIARCPL